MPSPKENVWLRPCLQLNNVSHVAVAKTMCHVATKSARSFIRSFFQAPVGTDSDRTASSLLSRLGQKRQKRWEEADNSIDFSYSSRKVWSTISKVTGRSGRASGQCLVLANSIASQLVNNKARKTGSHNSLRLINKQLSDLWKVPTPKGKSISDPFKPEETFCHSQVPETRKVSWPGFYFPGVYTLRRSGSQI